MSNWGNHAAPGSQNHKDPSTAARMTASVRVLTASLRKIRLTCDFTVSGEISRVRAMRSNRVTISRAVGHCLDKFALARMRLLFSRRTVPISAIEPEQPKRSSSTHRLGASVHGQLQEDTLDVRLDCLR